jgi:Flp pilus assembly protein TadD
MNQGDLAIETGDLDAALASYAAAESMQPDNAEMKFWHAVSRVNVGDVDGALPLFRAAFALDRSWAELLPRLHGVGLLDIDDPGLARILETGAR